MARIISALVFLPILLATIWRGSPIYFAVLVTVAAVLGLVEYYGIAERVEMRGNRVAGILAVLATLVAFYLGQQELVVLALGLLVIAELTIQLFTSRDLRASVGAVAASAFGVIYVAGLGGFLVALRLVPDGGVNLPAKLLSFFFLTVFAGDTGAYYVGRTLGRHKLAPRISPGKTIEGSVGGLISNVLAVLLSHFTFFPELPLASAVPLALVMGALGQVGDLCESMLKRGAQIKDAAQLIPGHGGVLDRLDSILFNAPVLYYYYLIFMK